MAAAPDLDKLKADLKKLQGWFREATEWLLSTQTLGRMSEDRLNRS